MRYLQVTDPNLDEEVDLGWTFGQQVLNESVSSLNVSLDQLRDRVAVDNPEIDIDTLIWVWRLDNHDWTYLELVAPNVDGFYDVYLVARYR